MVGVIRGRGLWKQVGKALDETYDVILLLLARTETCLAVRSRGDKELVTAYSLTVVIHPDVGWPSGAVSAVEPVTGMIQGFLYVDVINVILVIQILIHSRLYLWLSSASSVVEPGLHACAVGDSISGL